MTIFKQFDIVSDVSDHFFASPRKSRKEANRGEGKAKVEIKEDNWKALEKELPRSIFVRAYKGRPDLLRVVVVGPRGSPFKDGLFFFDLRFPRNFPTFFHPEVHLHPYNIPIHFPFSMNFISGSQVTMTLCKNLLLAVEQEFGQTEIGRRFKTHSDEYLYVLNCETMLNVMYRPPNHFDELVFSHFRERGGAILESCKAYMDGRLRIGGVTKNGEFSSSSKNVMVWDNFRASMQAIYPRLKRALDQFMVAKERDGYTEKKEEDVYMERKEKGGYVENAFNKVKMVMGLQKDSTEEQKELLKGLLANSF